MTAIRVDRQDHSSGGNSPLLSSFRARHAAENDPKRAALLKAIAEDHPRDLAFFKAAFAGKSRTKAIKAKCLECCWLNHVAIRDCTATECPLHGFRPYVAGGGQ